MPLQNTEWTLEMLHALPDDGNRYELIDGELLVSPSPALPHQRALGILHFEIRSYFARLGGFEVFFAPTAVTFSQRRELQPDLLVAPMIEGKPLRGLSDLTVLTLAVEVLSPSTARNDRYKKRRVYQEQGTGEFWIVDQPGRLVERWRPADTEPEVLVESLCWQPKPPYDPFVLDLVAFFREAAGE